MRLRIRHAATACVMLASLAAGTSALAADGHGRTVDVCPNRTGTCAEIRIVNAARVSAHLAVRRRPGGPNRYAGAVRRPGTPIRPGEGACARPGSRCIHVLRFDPGPFRGGDLRARPRPRRLANGHRLVTLSGRCGALQARTRVPERS